MTRINILAPLDGMVVELETVPDEVFAQKMAGDGVAINPAGGIAVAPVAGDLLKLFPGGHAFGIVTDDGIELIVHIGLDTVEHPVLLSGDVLFAGSIGRVDLPGGSMADMTASLRDVVLPLDDAAFAALDGVDTWIVDCFQRAAHKTHANVDQVIAWVERLRPRRTVLTHMGFDVDWEWLCKRLPVGIEPGYDGMVLEVED